MGVESADKTIFGWGEDEIKVSKLMLRHFNNQGKPTALHVKGRSARNTSSSSSSCGSESIDFDLMEVDLEHCFSSPREKFLDLKGKPTALHLKGRSARNTSSSSSSCGSKSIDFDLMQVDLEHCFSSPREKFLDLKTGEVYYLSSEEASETSSEVVSVQESSKFGSNIEEDDDEEGRLHLTMNLLDSKNVKSGIKMNDGIDTEEAESAMKLVGCHTCLMYFMVCGQDLKCPKCKGSSLLDFLD